MLLDILRTGAPEARVFALDTGVLFEETYATWREFERFFDVEIQAYQGPTLARQASLHGDALGGPPASRSGEPTPGSPACAASSRRRARTRRSSAWTPSTGCGRRARSLDWTEADVLAAHQRPRHPYHPLHDRGYESIGCTTARSPAAAARAAGRAARRPSAGSMYRRFLYVRTNARPP